MAKSRRLYISFHASDNSKGKNHAGWVDEFIRILEIFLQRVIGESPEIIVTESGNKTPLEEGDGIVVITSENYLKDKSYQKDAALLVDLHRIFKVDLSPISKTSLPNELRGLNEFHFFQSEGKKDVKFTTLNGRKTPQAYGLKIIDLAFEISRLLYKKNKQSENKGVKTVYLAETSYDQFSNRDNIKRELLRHGFEVLPKAPLSDKLVEVRDRLKIV